jgi:hypothetical protein
MAFFQTTGEFALEKDGITTERVAKLMKSKLEAHYRGDDILITPHGVAVNGCLNTSFIERVVSTQAEAEFKIEGRKLIYLVNATSSLRSYDYIYLGAALLCILIYAPLFATIPVAIFLFDLVRYALSRHAAKRYFDAALKAVQFDIALVTA